MQTTWLRMHGNADGIGVQDEYRNGGRCWCEGRIRAELILRTGRKRERGGTGGIANDLSVKNEDTLMPAGGEGGRNEDGTRPLLLAVMELKCCDPAIQSKDCSIYRISRLCGETLAAVVAPDRPSLHMDTEGKSCMRGQAQPRRRSSQTSGNLSIGPKHPQGEPGVFYIFAS